jgi:hypothetical protein
MLGLVGKFGNNLLLALCVQEFIGDISPLYSGTTCEST